MFRCFMLIYVVQEQDTVDSIAAAHQISAESVIYNNQIPSPYRLAVGEALLLSVDTADPAIPRPVIHAGGYAYPYINRWILSQTLPFLTDLYIFSYGFTSEGYLIPPSQDDTWMIEMAKGYGVAPILTLTPFGPDGRFNNNLISAVVNDTTARTRLKDEIILQITQRGFEGLDIDFEYILASDREAFVDFVSYMQQSVSALGYPVSVALAPKSSAEQTGLLYEGKDYAGLGAAADYVLLMTYEWGYTYAPAMAVAPINKVTDVVTYALTEIPAEKIHLGIPNYGYDWTLPYVRGSSAAQTLGNIQAVQLAIANDAVIQFDETAMSPFFTYTSADVLHEVWFEDVRSMNAKFDLMIQYQLRGCSYWNLMHFFRANWLLLQDRFSLDKIYGVL